MPIMSVQEFENVRWKEKPQKREFRHIAAAELIAEGMVLDVGCGDGLLLSILKESSIEAEGIDISEVAVAACISKGLKAVQGDFTVGSLPFADHSFTTTVALDVLEHVYDPGALLAEMERVASKEIIIGVPNFSSLPARLQVLFGKVPENNRPNKGHLQWFNWPVLTKISGQTNLAVREVKVNAPWERIPVLGGLTKGLAYAWPNLFALSFVVKYAKR